MQTGARPAASSRAPVGGAPFRRAFRPGHPVGACWRLERSIDTGTVFEVWAARGAQRERAAVKVPRRDAEDHDLARRLLRHEHACLVELAHDHVVAAFELVDTTSCAALVTEWLGGGDLVSLAGAAPGQWLEPLGELVVAILHLHAHGYVHRDIKARNVRFDARGRVRVIDFASAARIGARVRPGGTTAAHTRPVSSHSSAVCEDDSYALAVLIYELWTGRLPHGVDGRAPFAGVPTRHGPPRADDVLGWAMGWLEPARPARPGNIAALAAVMNLTDYV